LARCCGLQQFAAICCKLYGCGGRIWSCAVYGGLQQPARSLYFLRQFAATCAKPIFFAAIRAKPVRSPCISHISHILYVLYVLHVSYVSYVSYVLHVSYVSYVSYVLHVLYVSYVSYVLHVSYVSHISYVLYILHVSYRLL